MKSSLCLIPLLALTGCEKLKHALEGGSESEGPTAAETLGLNTVDLSDSEVDAFTRRSDQVVILDFHADWCGPCRSLGPKLERIANEFEGKVALGKINVDHASAAAARFGVSGIPDVRIFVNGGQIDRFVGDIPEAEVRLRIEPLAARAAGRLSSAPSQDPAINASGEPAIQPMKGDWMPPGLERK